VFVYVRRWEEQTKGDDIACTEDHDDAKPINICLVYFSSMITKKIEQIQNMLQINIPNCFTTQKLMLRLRGWEIEKRKNLLFRRRFEQLQGSPFWNFCFSAERINGATENHRMEERVRKRKRECMKWDWALVQARDSYIYLPTRTFLLYFWNDIYLKQKKKLHKIELWFLT